MTNELDDPLLTEVDVAETWMDPEYMRRYWEETRGALWHWSDWETAMAYRDQLIREAIAS